MISDSWLKSKVGKRLEKPDEVGDRDGMSVRVSRRGKITFQMRFRIDGKPARCDLGRYPKMTLAEARDLSKRMQKALDGGHDPRVVLRLEKDAIRNAEADTLNKLFTDWYAKVVVKTKPSHVQIRRSFEIHVLPKYGKHPSVEVTLHHWLDLLEELAARKPGITEVILTNAKQMLKWAVKRKRLPLNPLADISAKQDLLILRNRAKRALSNEELIYVWNAIDLSHLRPCNKLYLKLCLAYGCRHTELRKAKKEHFDLTKMIWTVPPENHKMGKKTKEPIVRPIVPEILPLITEAIAWSSSDSEYLFPKRGGTGMKSAQTHICWPINLTTWIRKNFSFKISHWSIKAFRKTARTNYSTLTHPHVAEIMLGHALPGSWGIYDLHKYLDEQALAYSAWCHRIMKLVGSNNLLGVEQWPNIRSFRPRSLEPDALAQWNKCARLHATKAEFRLRVCLALASVESGDSRSSCTGVRASAAAELAAPMSPSG